MLFRRRKKVKEKSVGDEIREAARGAKDVERSQREPAKPQTTVTHKRRKRRGRLLRKLRWVTNPKKAAQKYNPATEQGSIYLHVRLFRWTLLPAVLFFVYIVWSFATTGKPPELLAFMGNRQETVCSPNIGQEGDYTRVQLRATQWLVPKSAGPLEANRAYKFTFDYEKGGRPYVATVTPSDDPPGKYDCNIDSEQVRDDIFHNFDCTFPLKPYPGDEVCKPTTTRK